ncbi:MAG: tRNA (adenosine(37)-N6)-threonylcarbamoyltransferase complex ATPase subunit type 1 TsaE [Lachnospiraceae bacterium]|nr:tRNA (adenosine(37)-N6)-threonylcarbamoyltransferase complex ATPase subunit type 1 TsaE [Lachnospiraceae bacterium]
MRTETKSREETFAFAKGLGQQAKPGEVYALIGDLGVGKTVFTQGFAEGLGVGGYVNSPTFTILNSYEDGRLPLYHFDVYRIEDADEMEEIGYEDCLYGGGVCLIEWADRIRELLPETAVQITIEKDMNKGPDHRIITIDRNGI